MPSRVRLRAALAEMRGDRRLEVVHPRAHALVRHSDPAPCEQILDVTKAQCEPETEPNRLIYDLRHEPISGIADFPHTPGYSAYLHPTNCSGVTKATWVYGWRSSISRSARKGHAPIPVLQTPRFADAT